MTDPFQVGNEKIEEQEIPSLLKRYGLWNQFRRARIIDKAIASLSCTETERHRAIEDFAVQRKLTSAEAWNAWLQSQDMTREEMDEFAVRQVLIEKFKIHTFGPKLESYFLSRKTDLDKVVYSLIRTTDPHLAQEIYYRILEGEQSFEDLAREHSQGLESYKGGKLGPVPLSQPHPILGKLLSISQPGQLWSPRQLAEWYVIVRLEQFMPAKLDDPELRRGLLEEMFENWLREQLIQFSSLQSIGFSAASRS